MMFYELILGFSPGGGLYIYRQGSTEYFLGFEFRKSVLLGVVVIAAVFFLGSHMNVVLFTLNGIF